ncbi:hypothetical protein AB0H64_42065 [Nonomuraea sp. NPDC050733]|uniref:hypothetical protein n=1 Tax=Nonomuraea sp. NPDC050733 TaxID=3154633 RepID=UPI0033C83BC5
MTPRFRVNPTPGTETDAGAWRTLSLVVEDGGPPWHPVAMATFLLPGPLADELQRQVALLNDVLDLEAAQA